MTPPAILVRTARQLWSWQWRRLMGGLGPADPEGHYRRPESAFTALPPIPSDAESADAHVLIVGRSCPWAHRAWLTWTLRQLESSITLLVVEPDPAAGRWRFPSAFEGFTTLQQLYRHSGADPKARATVPALWSRHQGRILLNESARLIEMLNRWPNPGAPDLEPEARLEAITAWRHRLQGTVNDGVYRCGFARTQLAYDRAVGELFDTLEAVNSSLKDSQEPWLCGPQPTLADVVLFPTLIRFEAVYAPLFGCSRRQLWELADLWRWRSRFHALEGVAATCDARSWREDYFGALFPLHPSGIIPSGPELATLVGTCPAAP